jgi:thiamine pyrophosphokinase
MKKNKRLIKYKKERVILSDVLPFEIPVTFSNRHLYDFLTTNKISLEGGKLRWRNREPILEEIIKLLFDLREENFTSNSFVVDRKTLKTIPFNFKITHKENDFRELTIIHPKNQLEIVDFYEREKQLILHYCSISPYSIRKASKVAKFIFHKDKTHRERLANNQSYETIEEYDKEYEHLKTFFVYKNYSNIHKFYESYKYHRCEKKYNTLLKFDISKCFDSIYSHSISWALLNKGIVKDNLILSLGTLGGRFDAIMQNLNYGETNGIVIGPEFSRIFACIILQRIDHDVEISLRQNHNIIHKVDYEIFRYVDDFFVFFNDERTKEVILQEFKLKLKQYKLALNDSKTLIYQKPIITEITIAKQNITQLLNKYLTYKFEELRHEDNLELDDTHEKAASIYVSSNRLITKFKTIIKQTNIEYKEILNYTLALIERKISKVLKDFSIIEKKKNSERLFTNAILEILDFTFFLYAVSPRVNTTIKLCRTLRLFTEFLQDNEDINVDNKHLIFKKIYDNVFFTLNKNKSIKHAQVETLYLLIALRELGSQYWLDADKLRQYACIEKNVESGLLSFDGEMNYFSIMVLLFYMKDKTRYNDLREFLKENIKTRFISELPKNLGKNSELVLLLFDILTCPYLTLAFKQEILHINGVVDDSIQQAIIHYRKHWFTKWNDFNFGKELDAKHSQEVY